MNFRGGKSVRSSWDSDFNEEVSALFLAASARGSPPWVPSPHRRSVPHKGGRNAAGGEPFFLSFGSPAEEIWQLKNSAP